MPNMEDGKQHLYCSSHHHNLQTICIDTVVSFPCNLINLVKTIIIIIMNITEKKSGYKLSVSLSP